MKGRPNKLLLARLRSSYPTTFTTKQVEHLYIEKHMAERRYLNVNGKQVLDTYWARMSARNTLTMAVQRGLLQRVQKGVYTFVGVT